MAAGLPVGTPECIMKIRKYTPDVNVRTWIRWRWRWREGGGDGQVLFLLHARWWRARFHLHEGPTVDDSLRHFEKDNDKTNSGKG